MTGPSRTFALALLAAGCPQSPGDTTDGSTSSTATTSHPSPTSGTADSSGTTTPPTSTSTPTSGTDTDGTSSTSGTSGDDTDDLPVDVTCTYPGSTSSDPSSQEVAPECACIDQNGALTCASQLCPSIAGSCKDNQELFSDKCYGHWTYDEAALDCALVAARDGTEGTLRWGFSANSGFSGRDGFLHIVSERRAIRQDRNHLDLGGEASDTELWQLKDPNYFQGCIDLPSFCERLHCFFAGTTGQALSLCLPGFNYGGI